jgi:hypothetical protein
MIGDESDLWPRPPQDPTAATLESPDEPENVPVNDRDLAAQLRAVERVVAILVRRSNRRARLEILQAIDDTEAHP